MKTLSYLIAVAALVLVVGWVAISLMPIFRELEKNREKAVIQTDAWSARNPLMHQPMHAHVKGIQVCRKGAQTAQEAGEDGPSCAFCASWRLCLAFASSAHLDKGEASL